MKKYISFIGLALSLSIQSIGSPVYLSQTASQVPLAYYGVACADWETWETSEEGWMRVYDLSEYGIISSLNVLQVEFAVGWATGPNNLGSQPIEINIYTLVGPLLWANMTLISSTLISIPDMTLNLVTFNVTPALIPAGSLMVVEIHAFNNLGTGGIFFQGANPLGQTHPTYMWDVDCSDPEPVDISLWGFSDQHHIINVYGEADTIASVPVSNWAIFLGVGLMVVITAFIARRRMA